MIPYPVIILAGGLATRLRPLTEKIPKSLITVNNEPFIAHQLRLLKKNNIKQVVMCLGFLGEQVVEFVGNGAKFGVEVTYSFDGPTLLGTAGSIKKALPLVDDAFFVLYGDSYLTCDFLAIQESFVSSQKSALMTVFHNQGLWDTSNVEYDDDDKRILVYDKVNRTPRMHYIDYGLGLFHKNAFSSILENEIYDLALLYQNILKQDQLAAYEVRERFYEIGSFNGIKELESVINTLS